VSQELAFCRKEHDTMLRFALAIVLIAGAVSPDAPSKSFLAPSSPRAKSSGPACHIADLVGRFTLARADPCWSESGCFARPTPSHAALASPTGASDGIAQRARRWKVNTCSADRRIAVSYAPPTTSAACGLPTGFSAGAIPPLETVFAGPRRLIRNALFVGDSLARDFHRALTLMVLPSSGCEARCAGAVDPAHPGLTAGARARAARRADRLARVLARRRGPRGAAITDCDVGTDGAQICVDVIDTGPGGLSTWPKGRIAYGRGNVGYLWTERLSGLRGALAALRGAMGGAVDLIVLGSPAARELERTRVPPTARGENAGKTEQNSKLDILGLGFGTFQTPDSPVPRRDSAAPFSPGRLLRLDSALPMRDARNAGPLERYASSLFETLRGYATLTVEAQDVAEARRPLVFLAQYPGAHFATADGEFSPRRPAPGAACRVRRPGPSRPGPSRPGPSRPGPSEPPSGSEGRGTGPGDGRNDRPGLQAAIAAAEAEAVRRAHAAGLDNVHLLPLFALSTEASAVGARGSPPRAEGRAEGAEGRAEGAGARESAGTETLLVGPDGAPALDGVHDCRHWCPGSGVMQSWAVVLLQTVAGLQTGRMRGPARVPRAEWLDAVAGRDVVEGEEPTAGERGRGSN
jgi:hypothetical protein